MKIRVEGSNNRVRNAERMTEDHCVRWSVALSARSARCWVRVSSLLLFMVTGVLSACANGVVQEFYLPMPEAQLYQVFNAQAPFEGVGSNVNMATIISIIITTEGTVVYYDQWEDGYEVDINAPTMASTQVWGDGNDGNGICPGFVHDPLGVPAGTGITLRNNVPEPSRNFTTHPLLYDGGDRVGATRAITVTRACWEYDQRAGSQASAVEVVSTLDHGTSYIVPVGVDVLANGMFSFVDLMVMADKDNTTVVIDLDGTGASVVTNIIDRGALGAFLVNDLIKGAVVIADKPIQAHMITGNLFNGQYETRSYVLRPVILWSSNYIIPLGTVSTDYPGVAYIYNPSDSPLAVTFKDFNGSGTLTVPGAPGHLLAYTLPVNSGTLLSSVDSNPFFVICAMDAEPTGNKGADLDWGFAPMPFTGLTPEVVAGWAPGADTNPEFYTGQNGSPIWITPLSNTVIYVDFRGDHLGPLTDPQGGRYDTNFVVSALEVTAIYDSANNDQSGMRVYTLDGTLITGAWGADASVATPGPPFLDMGYALVPFPTFSISKSSKPMVDNAPVNVLNIGDVLEYTLRVDNRGLLPLGNLVVGDALPLVQLQYINDSTKLDNLPVADDTPGVNGRFTSFPLDEAGLFISIQHHDEAVFKYLARIRGIGTIVNSGYAGGDPTDPETPKCATTNFAYTILSVNDAVVVEGNAGFTTLVFPVTLSTPSKDAVTITFATSNGTAIAGSDYIYSSGTVTIPGNRGITSVDIVVQVTGDKDVEPDETFYLLLTSVSSNAFVIADHAIGTIRNDDSRVIWQAKWIFNPRRDSWFGTLTISNDLRSAQSLTAPPIWYEVKRDSSHRLRFPTGRDLITTSESDWYYLDLSSRFNAVVQSIGNKNQFLDQGEVLVVASDIELWGRGSVTAPPLIDNLVATSWISTSGPDIPTSMLLADMEPLAAAVLAQPSVVAIPSGPLISGNIRSLKPRIGLADVTITLSNQGGVTKTDAHGNYSIVVPSGWTGAVTPSLDGAVFSPRSRSFRQKFTRDKKGADFSCKKSGKR